MKKIWMFFSLGIGLTILACQFQPAPGKAQLHIDSTNIDFGIIKSMDTLRQNLSVKNTGSAPLLIEDIKASCGCTIPIWDKAAILPGQQQNIEILVLPEQIAHVEIKEEQIFNKQIVIRTNTDSLFTVVEVLGKIVPG